MEEKEVKTAMPKPATPKPDAFKSLTDNMPALIDNSAVTKISSLVLLKDGKGKTHKGFCQVYTTDMSAPHINKKAGDVVFFDTENNPLVNIKSFK